MADALQSHMVLPDAISSISLSSIKYLSFNGARAQSAGQDSTLCSTLAFYLLSFSLSHNRIIHNTIKLKCMEVEGKFFIFYNSLFQTYCSTVCLANPPINY